MQTSQNINPQTNRQQVIIIRQQKSVAVAFILSLLLGPLGMFYATVRGAIVMVIISVLMLLFVSEAGLIISWIAGVVWAIVAVKNTSTY
ncbi:MAG: hypothetical protein ABI723_24500 [Bacteroidia bacterium]